MPDGVIVDPRQNQRERNFGIVRLLNNGLLYKYRKGPEEPTRFYLFGEVVATSQPGPVEIEEVDSFIIQGWVDILGYAENQNRCPVYRRIIHPLNEHARRAAIRNAMDPHQDNMPSDFENPPHP